jgi:hypothetical protein
MVAHQAFRRLRPTIVATLVSVLALAGSAGAAAGDGGNGKHNGHAKKADAPAASAAVAQPAVATPTAASPVGGASAGQVSGAAVSGATYSGTTSPAAVSASAFTFLPYELVNMPEVEEGPDGPGGGSFVNRHSHGQAPFTAPTIAGASTVAAPAGFAGINHRDQRLANNANQFSLEPPDQGLCVGNGFVLETVNDALRIFNTAGTPLTPTIALNAFYGYAPAIVRSTPPAFGPFVTDPSCWYDGDTQRWYHVVLTLDVVSSSGAFTGGNTLDIAVSKTSDPTGAWNIWHLNVANDGGDVSTANHPQCPCLGDYPQIGVDAYGFYIATNEYSFFKNKFNGAQLYAMSKRALAAGVADPTIVSFDNLVLTGSGTTGFTVWPARSLPGQHATTAGGTEYFLSSLAGEEAKNKIGAASQIGIWALTNTSSLETASPDLTLTNRALDSQPYGVPPPADQKVGTTPLRDCINDRTTVFATTPAGPVYCAEALGGTYAGPEVEGPLDSSDTRMQQVWYSNGLLYGALDTAVNVGGNVKAGIAWFIVRPTVDATGGGKVIKRSVDGTIVKQGYLGVANNNVVYPAIAVRPDGKGVMAFTLAGADYYPSAAWTTIDATNGVGTSIRVSGAGTSPQDGFSEYKAFASDPDSPRPRWGDYGAAAVDGNVVWIASEYIGTPPCTLAEFVATAFSCNATRTALANWGTYITPVTP